MLPSGPQGPGRPHASWGSGANSPEVDAAALQAWDARVVHVGGRSAGFARRCPAGPRPPASPLLTFPRPRPHLSLGS